MRLLVTGAGGFTGRYVVSQALEEGWELHELKSDLCEHSAVQDEVKAFAPTHVIHLASISAVTHLDEMAFYKVNVMGSANLLNSLCALTEAPEKVIIASSANIYGNSDHSPITESEQPCPNNHYAISKLSMEYMSATFADRLPILVTRPFNYTGVGHDQRFVVPKLIRHFANKSQYIELGNIDVEREFNDVRFVRDAYISLLRLGKPGETYNLCSGRPISLQSVINKLKVISGHEIEVRLNQEFVRPNEVYRLCGDPAKLRNCVGDIETMKLEETLSWMLESELSFSQAIT